MSLKTQGTHLFIIDPDDCSVLQIECPRGISGFGGTIGEDDDTCLEDEGQVFSPGAVDAGSPTFDLNYDPSKASHVRLYELFRDKTPNLQLAIGFSDGTAAPTAELDSDNECGWVLPTSRTYGLFQGFISGMPLDFALNARVTTTVTIRANGFPSIQHKTT